jgi:hypothetical protein
MPLEIPVFDVALARDGLDLTKAYEAGEGDGYDVHRVPILHADQLVAEQAGPRYGLGELNSAPMAWTTLWCWAAMRRTGIDVPEYPLCKARVISIDKVKDTEAPPVDPTRPGEGTPSPSPSPDIGPPSTSGSPPTTD